MFAKVSFFVVVLSLLGSCAGTVGEYQQKTEQLLADCDSVEAELNKIDTADLTTKLQDARMNLVDLKANLKTDTLDLETARGLDKFVRAYKLCKTAKVDWVQAKTANDSLKVRLEILLEDIKTGAGDRSDYAIAVKNESRELEAIRHHGFYLDSLLHEMDLASVQFKPIEESFTLFIFVNSN